MPSITIKRKTVGGYEELYPTTDWSQINNLPSTFTPTSHLHGDITNAGAITSGTVAVASGDAILITDVTQSNLVKRSSAVFGTSTTTYLRNDGSFATPSNFYPTALSKSNGTFTLTMSGVSNITMDDYATTTIASLAANTLSVSSYSVTGYRFATIQLSRTAANTTTTVYTTRVDLSDTNQFSASTGTSRFHRMVWNDGTNTWADNLELYAASATTVQFRHSAGQTMRYRITWEK